MLSAAQLLTLWVQREKDGGERKARDRAMLELFGGKLAVPLPEIDSHEESAVANIAGQGITAQAQRIASVPPRPTFPIDRPSKAARDRARTKQRALLGMWDENKLHLQRQQRARWLIAYASSPVLLWPKRRRDGNWTVCWEPRSWLSCYPAPTPTHLDMEPRDVIFAASQNRSSLEAYWPEHAAALRAMCDYNPNYPRDDVLTVLEYSGPDGIMSAAVGVSNDRARQLAQYASDNVAVSGNRWCVVLLSAPNRIERCTAIVPNLVSLEEPVSKYERTRGMYMMQAKLMALEYRTIANAVDPQQWFVEADTGGEIIQQADGPGGVMGHVRGGTIAVVNVQPGYKASEMTDRLERYQRLEAGVPAAVGGEAASNIRTARYGQDLLASVMDFPIQEAQQLLAESQKLEDDIAIDMTLAYFPDERRTWAGFTFTPADTFTRGEWHSVDYSLAGADADGLTIRLGQLVGTNFMSLATARAQMPGIADPEFEADQVVAEQIEAGILAEFMQPDPTGNVNLVVKARVKQLVSDNKLDLADAILKAQQEWQEKQATTTGVVEPGAPEAQPGIAPPGVGVEAATAPPGGADMNGLSSLLASLRTPQAFATAGESAAEAGAVIG